MGRKLLPLSSCKTDVTCDLKSATQIFGNIPFQYGEGGFFLSIEMLKQEENYKADDDHLIFPEEVNASTNSGRSCKTPSPSKQSTSNKSFSPSNKSTTHKLVTYGQQRKNFLAQIMGV
ncbi:unnamed protein product [Amoebophrya sp. A120]|nr:unnamed protein product [Amoebophrya sp. A120]|eukprot:GSA120T00002953001.1